MNMQPEHRLRLFGFSVVLAGAVMADAACAADAYNGGQIARRWCEPYHVVAADGQDILTRRLSCVPRGTTSQEAQKEPQN